MGKQRQNTNQRSLGYYEDPNKQFSHTYNQIYIFTYVHIVNWYEKHVDIAPGTKKNSKIKLVNSDIEKKIFELPETV